MLSSASDAVLITRYREGNNAAGVAIYLRYIPLLQSKAKAASRSLSLPGCEYEDIYQEASLGFLSALKAYDESKETSFGAFAKVCIQNRLKNFAAAQYTSKMHAYRERVSFEETGKDLPDTRQNPEMLYLIKEQLSAVEHNIQNKLSQLERDIFYLYLSGQNYKFIASKLGIPSKSVDNALQRVRRKLKNLAVEDSK